MVRSDTDIQKDIVAGLKWEPSLRDDDIAVKGVKAITNDIQVKLASSSTRPDPDIAPGVTEVENRLTVEPSVYAAV